MELLSDSIVKHFPNLTPETVSLSFKGLTLMHTFTLSLFSEMLLDKKEI